MKRILLLTLCLIVGLTTATARKKLQPPPEPQGVLPAGYYFLQTTRTETGFAYVGQVQMPEGIRGTYTNSDALRLCWSFTQPWSIPEQPDRETARYIFRFEQVPNMTYSDGDVSEPYYSIQNLGYGRYVTFPEGLYLALPTATTPRNSLFLIRPSEMLEGGFTINFTTGIYDCLHASRDVNTVVEWDAKELASHWRIIPVDEAYAQEAFRIFNPLTQSSVIPTEDGRICETPTTWTPEAAPVTEPATVPEASAEVIPATVLDAILSQYRGQKTLLIVWNAWDRNSQEVFERTKSMRKSLQAKGVKLVFVTDETTSVYDWLDQVKELSGDHYRIPTLAGTRLGGAPLEVIPSMLITNTDHADYAVTLGCTGYSTTENIGVILNFFEEQP